MKKREIQIGQTYVAKISRSITAVKILRESRYGGWDAVNLRTNRPIRIRSAAKLRRPFVEESVQ